MDPRFAQTQFLIEADSFARLQYFKDHRHEVEWVHEPLILYIKVGELAGEPVIIQCQWAVLNGIRIMFYSAASKIVDHNQIDLWLEKHCNPTWHNGTERAHCNSMNFHHCMLYVKDPSRR